MEKKGLIPDSIQTDNFLLSIGPVIIIGLMLLSILRFQEGLNEMENFSNASIDKSKIGRDIKQLDLILTNSARIYALTGEMKWRKTYYENVSVLDERIDALYDYTKVGEFTSSLKLTEKSNALLVEMEERSFLLVEQGKIQQAKELLFSDFYNEQKENYRKGIDSVLTSIESLFVHDIKKVREDVTRSFVMIIVILLFTFMLWIFFFIKSFEKRRSKELKNSYKANMDILNKFTASLGHELNGPLSLVDREVKNLKRFTEVHISEMSQSEAVYLEELEDGLLQGIGKIQKITQSMIRLEFGRNHEKKVFSSYEVIVNAESDLSLLLRKYNIKVVNQVPQGRYYILGDGHLLQMAFVEILNNSIDAIKNTYNPWIKITFEKLDEKYLFRIIDSGKGIPVIYVEKIFELLFTTKVAEESSGIGLNFVSLIIKEAGGNVFYELYEGHTSFCVELPIPN